MIPTLTGGIRPDDLGVTLTHEHILVLNAELVVNYPNRFPADDLVNRAVQYLDEVKASGVDTIVDLTVMGTGRNIPLVQRIAERSDINVVVATGWYTHHEAPTFAHLNGPGRLLGGPDPLTEIFIRDIIEGIDDTGVRAGVLKFAADRYGITDGVFAVMQAVADAHLETGVPIFTHSDPGRRNGLDQQDYLEKRGIDLSAVVVGHCGDTDDLDYLRCIADRGSFLGMDRFGLESRLPYVQRIETVVRLCELGYAPSMVLATDSSAYSMNFPDSVRQERLPRWRAQEVMGSVVPDLIRRGVSEDDIHTMMTVNPARILDPAHRSKE
jgi:phosphotriesterase-related protein